MSLSKQFSNIIKTASGTKRNRPQRNEYPNKRQKKRPVKKEETSSSEDKDKETSSSEDEDKENRKLSSSEEDSEENNVKNKKPKKESTQTNGRISKRKKSGSSSEEECIGSRVGSRKTRKKNISYLDTHDEEEKASRSSDEESSDFSKKQEKSEKSEKDDEDKGPRIDKILGIKKEDDKSFFLVKFSNKAYIHAKWLTKQEVLQLPQGNRRISTFLTTQNKQVVLCDDEDISYINPDYVIVERIIAYSDTLEDDSEFKEGYLVKWKLLPYDQTTWESSQWVEKEYPLLVEQFKKFNMLPPKETRKKSSDPTERHAENFDEEMDPPMFKQGITLREYQVEGFKWLCFCWFSKRSSILADEMGLGKTIQSISVLQWLWQVHKIRGPFLVVSPMACLEQWRREIETWTDLNTVVYHGTQKARDLIREHEFYFEDYKDNDENLYKFNILLTTYDIFIKDGPLLSSVYWKYVIIDEAHRMKNVTSQSFKTLSKLKFDQCLLMSGTPIQNNLKELWAMLSFIDSKKFHSYEKFEKQFGNLKNSRHVQNLQKSLAQYLLRRTKETVAKDIPSKEETIIQIEMTRTQKKYYKAIFDKNREMLCMGTNAQGPSLMNILVQQRKVCSHPFLIEGVEEIETKDLDPEEKEEILVTSSAKLVLLDKLLKRFRDEGHKVLIFSQMVKMLDILEDYCVYKKWPFERLDGGTERIKRQVSIDKFNLDADSFLFLISTKAGGLGLNLTAADTVVLFDSDWNPQNDLQAQARCHRIGQTRNVKVYRLVTRETCEQNMFNIANKKLGLNQALLGTSGFGDKAMALSTKEIDQLLKHGAVMLFGKDEDTEERLEQEMINEDVDSILSRSLALHSNSTPTFVSDFVVEKDDVKISMKDKDFWTKIFPNFKSSGALKKSLYNNSLQTEAAKIQYLADLKQYVQRTKESVQGRSTFASHGPILEATQFLLEVERSPLFTDEEKKIIRSERNCLQGTKRRMVNRNKDEEPGPEPVTEKESKTKVDEPPWTKTHRNRLKTELLKYGYGRWEELFQSCNFSKKKYSIEDLQAYVENIVYQIFLKANRRPEKAGKQESEIVEKSETLKESEKSEEGTEQRDMKVETTEKEKKTKKSKKEKEPKNGKDKKRKNITNDQKIENTVLPWKKTVDSILKKIINDTSQQVTKDLLMQLDLKRAPEKLELESEEAEDQGDSRPLVLTSHNSSSGEPPSVSPGVQLTFSVTLPPINKKSKTQYFILFQYRKGEITRRQLVRHALVPQNETEVTICAPGFIGPYLARLFCVVTPTNQDTACLKAMGCPVPFQVNTYHSTLTIDGWDIAKQYVIWSQRFILMRKIRILIGKYGPNLENLAKFPGDKLKLPVWWWSTPEHDKLLLGAIWRCGYVKFDQIFKSEEYGFQSESFQKHLSELQNYFNEKNPENSEKYKLDAMPTNNAITKHISGLVDLLFCL